MACTARTVTFRPLVDDPTDGADTIAWIREQPWCDGTVGMYGGSYLGWTQWAAAAAEALEGLQGDRADASPPPTSTPTPWYSPGGATSWHAACDCGASSSGCSSAGQLAKAGTATSRR